MSTFLEILIQVLFYGITELIILIACYKYYSKSRTTDSKLLFFGCLTSLVGYIFQTIYFHDWLSPEINNLYLSGIISTVTGVFMFLGALFFSIGFYLFVKRVLVSQKNLDENGIDHLGKS